VAAAVMLVFWAQTARGAAPSADIVAPGIDGCISGDELLERVQQNMGGAPPPAELRLRVEIEPDGSGLRARIGWVSLGQLGGQRTLGTAQPQCEELDDALVLVATTLLEELKVDAPRAREPAPPPPKPASSPPPSPEPASPLPALRPRDRVAPRSAERRGGEMKAWSSSVSGGVGVAYGILSETIFSPRVDVRIAIARPWAVWFGAQATPSGSSRKVESSRVEFATALATLAGCYAPLVTTSLVLDGCAGMMGGTIVTSGIAVRGSPDQVRPLASPLAAAAFSAPVFGPLVLRGHLAGGMALFREHYILTDSSGNEQVVRAAEVGLWEAAVGVGFLL